MADPDPAYTQPWGELTQTEKSALENLRNDGIVVVPGLFDADVIDRLRRQFDDLLLDLKSAGPEECEEKHWECRADDEYFTTNQAARDLPAYLEIASSPTLLRIGGEYLQRPFVLRRTQAIHQGTVEMNDYGSFQWHHDQCGPQFKMILLLTEVQPGGQHTQVVRGSHTMRYPFDRFNGWSAKQAAKEAGREVGPGSRYSEEEVAGIVGERQDAILSGTGPAGSAILFDSNALHRGRRGLSAIRNTAVFMFSPLPGLKVAEVQIRKSDLDAMPAETQAVFTGNSLLNVL